MAEVTHIVTRVLEQMHYINFPQALSRADLTFLEKQIPEWRALPVDLHVLDLKGMKHANARFFRAIKGFTKELKPGQFMTLNLSDELQLEIAKLKLLTIFNPSENFEPSPTKNIEPHELKRLLIRYLIRGAYTAIETGLNSTVSCDENYITHSEKVPFHEFDLISVVDVHGEFLNAQFRLCGSAAVLHRLASRMLGPTAVVDSEMVGSMALELLNLIYGFARSKLNDDESFRLPPAIPRLLRKEQFGQIKRSTSPFALSVLPLVTPLGSFYVEVDFGVRLSQA